MILAQFLSDLVAGRECTVVRDNAARPVHSYTETAPSSKAINSTLPSLLRKSRQSRRQSQPALKRIHASRWEMQLNIRAQKFSERPRPQKRSVSAERPENRRLSDTNVIFSDKSVHRAYDSAPDLLSSHLNYRLRQLSTPSTTQKCVSPSRVSEFEPHSSSREYSVTFLSKRNTTPCRWSSNSVSSMQNVSCALNHHRVVASGSTLQKTMPRNKSHEDLLSLAPPKKPVRQKSFREDTHRHTIQLLARTLHICSDGKCA